MVTYVKGDATKPQGDGKKIIAHVCNDEGLWGSGFVLAVNKLSPLPRMLYLQEHKFWTEEAGFTFTPLGVTQLVTVAENLMVCNMVAQHRTIRHVEKPICYKSLEAALNELAGRARDEEATVHMPRIGAGLARGNWEVIESIVNRTLTLQDVDVTVYDL
ncbi:hypothetical protein SEA_BILLNYE_128 [Streptomyces phage BillNye]|uniref:Macro domain-containing protein n=1 Tax=Streptomyces phage BillNye TaxID=2079426 RepID=A0A2L1IVW3_9CAUD|nr:hypothetical protein FDJ30_gp128 [Streptomyces phage BillNye]AVD99305.1 hypothetical protein SEA_BILLNYE_128 [Streptomyces phage BillNye]